MNVYVFMAVLAAVCYGGVALNSLFMVFPHWTRRLEYIFYNGSIITGFWYLVTAVLLYFGIAHLTY